DRKTAERLTNYRIVAPGRDGRFGTHDDKVIAIASAVYNSTLHTVTLAPKRRLDLHHRFELVINGSSAAGVTDVSGNLLDGNRDGRLGDNFVAILRGFGIDKRRIAFNRLIREQLHGQ